MARHVGRLIKWGIGVGIAGSTTMVLYHNNWDVSSIGAVRFGRAACTCVVVAADYKWALSGMDASSQLYNQVKSQVHRRSAERLRAMCCRNGGCFIKVGQHVGALEYLLPYEYVDTMKVLHSKAPQSPLPQLLQVVKEDLGKEVDDIFSSFDPEPLGAASLAQVHKATLKDGTPVAVKIQHPKVKAHSFVDMATMELLIHAVAWLFPEFKFLWLAEETKKNLPKELDFYHEAKNCERMGRMFSKFSFLKVPQVYWDLTTERVLTMEYCEGGQVNDRDYMQKHNISVEEVSRHLGKLYSEMIFVQGYVHCDPHPGNVLVHKTKSGHTSIVLLDHGLYQTLTDTFRLNYCHLWLSLIKADVEGIKEYATRLGTGHMFGLFACMVTARSWKAVSSGIDKQPVTQAEDQEIKENAAQYLPQISDILNSVPREMLLIFKTNDLLRGIEHNLKTRANARSFITMSRCCVRAVYRHKRRLCESWVCRAKMTLLEHMTLMSIWMYETYLWFKSTPLVQRVASLAH